MTTPSNEFRVCIVLGEESGDALAANLLPTLTEDLRARGLEPIYFGLAGTRLSKMGIRSWFDIEEVAVMGISAVAARLPKIIKRVYETVSNVVEARPDLLLIIDSPDFTHAVAKRVRKKLPDLPIVDYVCPSVWAWRSGRAAKMTAYVDHVLALLPFEPEILQRLNGPSATYVGHPLSLNMPEVSPGQSVEEVPKLLVLPGSRSSEIKRLLGPFGQTLEILRNDGVSFEPVIPAVPHLRTLIEERVAEWTVQPEIVDSSQNEKTFASARAALAASGTVTLQLAVNRVPTVVAYILDPVARQMVPMLDIWSVVLPNHIAGWPVMPEELNEYAKPERMARRLKRLLADTSDRHAQLDGMDVVRENLRTDRPTSNIASEAIISAWEAKSGNSLTVS